MKSQAMQNVRDRLVMAALPHVPFEGWSLRALREGAADAGFDPSMVGRAFPGGPVAAVEHFCDLADRRLAAEAAAQGIESMRLSERVAWLVRRRLEAWSEHREAVRRAVTLLALPGNGAVALRATWRTADALWHAAGDRSVDVGYYTKRLSLSAVYSTTLFSWLEDQSEGFADSWDFLGRRLADVARLPKIQAQMRRRLQTLPNPFGQFLKRARSGRHF
ncbi:MAG TPA: COQ9 family protein [Rhodospirillaceae bacterium]|nr:COQ9 family protein [Rhodospirillaceae bacterium]